MEGMRGFARRHFPSLPPESTEVVCLDSVGSPELILIEGEGMLRMRDYTPELRDRIAAVAERAGVHLRRGLRLGLATDGLIALRAGYPSAAIGSVTKYKLPLELPLAARHGRQRRLRDGRDAATCARRCASAGWAPRAPQPSASERAASAASSRRARSRPRSGPPRAARSSSPSRGPGGCRARARARRRARAARGAGGAQRERVAEHLAGQLEVRGDRRARPCGRAWRAGRRPSAASRRPRTGSVARGSARPRGATAAARARGSRGAGGGGSAPPRSRRAARGAQPPQHVARRARRPRASWPMNVTRPSGAVPRSAAWRRRAAAPRSAAPCRA